jgi:MYXO-CTERM domain-containing protein
MGWRIVVLGSLIFAAACESGVTLGSESQRIAGGTFPEPGAWPWVVGMDLGFDGDARCSGTLLRNDMVLTAAHCVTDGLDGLIQAMAAGTLTVAQVEQTLADTPNSGTMFGTVYVGATEMGDDTGKRSRAKRYMLHPSFLSSVEAAFIGRLEADSNGTAVQTQFPYDVAVIQLASPVDVEPAVLRQPGDALAATDAIALGYGANDIAGSQIDNRLREAALVIIDSECAGDGHCAAGLELRTMSAMPGQQVCGGDSGGPLVVDGVVVGVLSRSDAELDDETLCDGNTPDIYGRVDVVAEWLGSVQFGEFNENDDEVDEGGGCGCRTSGSPGFASLALLLMAMFAPRLRARRRS